MTDISSHPRARFAWLTTLLLAAACGGSDPDPSGMGGAGGGGTAGTTGEAGTDGTGGTGTSGGAGTTGGGGMAGTAAACTPVSTGGSVGGPQPDNITFLPNVTVATLTGGATEGAADGAPGVGTLSNPVSVALEAAGSLVVSDFDNNRLRRVAADGTISTLTNQASFTRPYGVGFAGSTLYAHTDNNPSGARSDFTGTIWRIDPTSGAASVVAPDLGRPRAFAALSDGRLVLSDAANERLRLLNPTSGAVSDLAGIAACPGSAEGTGSGARFMQPAGVVVLAGNRIVVADLEAHVLRAVTVTGVVTTFAGEGVAGTIDGPRATARFNGPRALAADASGAVFVAEINGHRIRRIAADGTVTTVAGDGTSGFQDGPGNMAKFYGQEGLAVSPDGLTIYVADGDAGSDTPLPYHRIRKITIAP